MANPGRENAPLEATFVIFSRSDSTRTHHMGLLESLIPLLRIGPFFFRFEPHYGFTLHAQLQKMKRSFLFTPLGRAANFLGARREISSCDSLSFVGLPAVRNRSGSCSGGTGHGPRSIRTHRRT
jgi:hypothetical protein